MGHVLPQDHDPVMAHFNNGMVHGEDMRSAVQEGSRKLKSSRDAYRRGDRERSRENLTAGLERLAEVKRLLRTTVACYRAALAALGNANEDDDA